MILVIDNYDSFVGTLARYMREAGHETTIIRNDAASVGALLALRPEAVVISPGPKAPACAGVSLDLIRRLPRTTPFLGVCLGCQCLIEAFGGETRRAITPMHGAADLAGHDGEGLFTGLSNPLFVGRYNSLACDLGRQSPLRANAFAADGDIMAVRLEDAPWFGVQFHPESVLTPEGRKLIHNFLAFVEMEPGR